MILAGSLPNTEDIRRAALDTMVFRWEKALPLMQALQDSSEMRALLAIAEEHPEDISQALVRAVMVGILAERQRVGRTSAHEPVP